ncbi:MAG: 50S ribosomal protein L11 methyltransferase [Halieaceae bacterium]
MIDAALTARLGDSLPGARIEAQGLPELETLQLYLLNEDYPQQALSGEAIQHLMDNPLYWVFCWASGQVLANRLLSHPQWVRGKRILDFGCGSGVVAIAAAMAGADSVIACDNDPDALAATASNARLNQVELELAADYAAVDGELDMIIVADVLYDRGNLPWLTEFSQRAAQVLVADSRIRDFQLPPYRRIGGQTACTIPDLDESAEFRKVNLYLAGPDL